MQIQQFDNLIAPKAGENVFRLARDRPGSMPDPGSDL